jgi:hypothetical protein
MGIKIGILLMICYRIIFSSTQNNIRLSFWFRPDVEDLAPKKIKMSLLDLDQLNSSKPNSFLTRIFFDAKSDEILPFFQEVVAYRT